MRKLIIMLIIKPMGTHPSVEFDELTDNVLKTELHSGNVDISNDVRAFV